MAFADRLKEARLNKEFTQEQIAQKVGIAKSTYTGYEKGTREPNVNTIGKLMTELGVDANFLWQDDMTFPFQLSYDEMENIIKKYRALDAHGKEMVNIVLSKEHSRCVDYLVNTDEGAFLIESQKSEVDTDNRIRIYNEHLMAAHNDHLQEEGELEKVRKDIASLKRPE